MDMNFLDFEQKIAELIAQTNELKRVSSETGGIDLTASISALEKETNELTRKIFSNLGDWQVSRLSRHPMRPYTKDYISRIFTDFDEL
ncbi:MAG: acetyl-CoA carboxylase carboxyl transferase subunit alpha, partial [Succinivibrionaceae bacterium]|nr:acetyl-CoA carboxylase carboxyl transferase subunit alpha [Succinivibrionaceae bacterium]